MKIKSLCEKVLDEFGPMNATKRAIILAKMIRAVKGLSVDIDEQSLRTCAKQFIKHSETTQTFSINNCPRALSGMIKEIARSLKKGTPSELVIDILTDYVNKISPGTLKRSEALIEFMEVDDGDEGEVK